MPQGTTQPKPPAEAPIGGQTAFRCLPFVRADPVRNRATAPRDLRKALCMGGVFAVSTVLPEKIQRLAAKLEVVKQFVPGDALEHSLQVAGCFLVLSVLIWASRSEPHPVRPLLAYPPSQQRDAHGPHRWFGGWRVSDADLSRSTHRCTPAPSPIPSEQMPHPYEATTDPRLDRCNPADGHQCHRLREARRGAAERV